MTSAVTCRAPDFEKRGVKLIGISANGLSDHEKWVKDINEWGSKFGPTDVQYPIVSVLTSCNCRCRLLSEADRMGSV